MSLMIKNKKHYNLILMIKKLKTDGQDILVPWVLMQLLNKLKHPYFYQD